MTNNTIDKQVERIALLHPGVISYPASELEERRKNDWKESKNVVKKVFPRKVGV